MVLYFAKTNADNLLLAVNEESMKAKYWHGNSDGISPDGIDLYAYDALEQLKSLYSNNDINDFDSMVGDSNNIIIDFNADELEDIVEVCRG